MEPICRTVSVHKKWGAFPALEGIPLPLFIYAIYKRKRVLACFCMFCLVLGAVFGSLEGYFCGSGLGSGTFRKLR